MSTTGSKRIRLEGDVSYLLQSPSPSRPCRGVQLPTVIWTHLMRYLDCTHFLCMRRVSTQLNAASRVPMPPPQAVDMVVLRERMLAVVRYLSTNGQLQMDTKLARSYTLCMHIYGVNPMMHMKCSFATHYPDGYRRCAAVANAYQLVEVGDLADRYWNRDRTSIFHPFCGRDVPHVVCYRCAKMIVSFHRQVGPAEPKRLDMLEMECTRVEAKVKSYCRRCEQFDASTSGISHVTSIILRIYEHTDSDTWKRMFGATAKGSIQTDPVCDTCKDAIAGIIEAWMKAEREQIRARRRNCSILIN